MTTAERREAILAQLGRKPIAARTLAAKYGVSRQVIVQDLAPHPRPDRAGAEPDR